MGIVWLHYTLGGILYNKSWKFCVIHTTLLAVIMTIITTPKQGRVVVACQFIQELAFSMGMD